MSFAYSLYSSYSWVARHNIQSYILDKYSNIAETCGHYASEDEYQEGHFTNVKCFILLKPEMYIFALRGNTGCWSARRGAEARHWISCLYQSYIVCWIFWGVISRSFSFPSFYCFSFLSFFYFLRLFPFYIYFFSIFLSLFVLSFRSLVFMVWKETTPQWYVTRDVLIFVWTRKVRVSNSFHRANSLFFSVSCFYLHMRASNGSRSA